MRASECDVWSVLQEMSQDANTPVINSSIFFTQSWLILVTLLTRLHTRGRHRFALVVAETQEIQNVLHVSLTRCNMNGVRVNPRSRRTEVTVLRPPTHWLCWLQLEPCTQFLSEPCQFLVTLEDQCGSWSPEEWLLVKLFDPETIRCRHDKLIELLCSFPSPAKLSLQFPPGVLQSSTAGVVPLHPFFWRPTVDFFVFFIMEIRILCIEAQVEYPC